MIDQITASDSSDVMFPLFKVEEHVDGWKMEGGYKVHSLPPIFAFSSILSSACWQGWHSQKTHGQLQLVSLKKNV